MSVTLPSIPVLFSSPQLQNKIAQELGIELQAGCPWIEKVFGVAQPGYRALASGKITREPEIFMNDGTRNYYVVVPDDKLKAYIFFALDAPVNFDFDNGDEARYELSVFCWVDLHKLDGGRNYDYTSELAMDMMRVLRESANYSERIGDLQLDLDPKRMFERYNLPDDYHRYMSYPFSGFRIGCTVLSWDNPECFSFVNTGTPPC